MLQFFKINNLPVFLKLTLFYNNKKSGHGLKKKEFSYTKQLGLYIFKKSNRYLIEILKKSYSVLR